MFACLPRSGFVLADGLFHQHPHRRRFNPHLHCTIDYPLLRVREFAAGSIANSGKLSM